VPTLCCEPGGEVGITNPDGIQAVRPRLATSPLKRGYRFDSESEHTIGIRRHARVSSNSKARLRPAVALALPGNARALRTAVELDVLAM
jgi:hypothetical protein